MIYLKHNLQQNIASANSTKDPAMREDIVLSEIGKRIAVRPEVVIGFLKKSDINVSDTASTGKMVSLVSKNIGKNKNLIVLFAKDIGAGEGSELMAKSIYEVFKKPGAESELMKYTKAIKGIALSADGGDDIKWGARVAVGIVVVLGIGFAVYKYKNG